MQAAPARYLQRVSLVDDRVSDFTEWPFSLAVIRELSLRFERAVTFFVGENGSGKSTLIEAIAELCGLPVSGGGRNEGADRHGPEQHSALARALRPTFARRPSDSYFFRAEFQSQFASLLDHRRTDIDFLADPYKRYGGRSLHTRSHGEAFLAVMLNRMSSGLFLLDEPESALSPQRQLSLLARMHTLVSAGATQLIIATHSPILLTLPGAQILSFDGDSVVPVRLENTSHYQITREILSAPEQYWRHLGARSETT